MFRPGIKKDHYLSLSKKNNNNKKNEQTTKSKENLLKLESCQNCSNNNTPKYAPKYFYPSQF